MKTALAIRHVAFEDLGTLAPVLALAGYAVDVVEAADGLERFAVVAGDREALAPDLVIVLGGPIGAYEDQAYPFLRDELHLIERRLAADRPVLGICLGAQLMARALGARVYEDRPGNGLGAGQPQRARRVILPAPLDLRYLRPPLAWRHVRSASGHDPPGVERALRQPGLLADVAALALQFHLEATYPSLERWFVGHAGELAATDRIDVRELRAASRAHGPSIARAGAKVFAEWLAGLNA